MPRECSQSGMAGGIPIPLRSEKACRIAAGSEAAAASALCSLVAGTDQDDTLGNGVQFTLANLLTHEFAAAGTVDFRCSTGGAQSVAQIRIVAIKVGNLTAS